jgi:hypothetical protein
VGEAGVRPNWTWIGALALNLALWMMVLGLPWAARSVRGAGPPLVMAAEARRSAPHPSTPP